MTNIRAWHNNPALKAEAVTTMQRHRQADEFMRGSYISRWGNAPSGFKGCFHGCLTAEKIATERKLDLDRFLTVYLDNDEFEDNGAQVDWHADGERIWGIDRRVGRVLDNVFESIQDATFRADWAVRVTEAIPVGADLVPALSGWVLDILADPDHGVVRHTAEGSLQRTAVEDVAGLYRRRLAGNEPTAEQWETGARQAREAQRAAYAAAAAAYAAAAYAAAYAAYAAAAYAADGVGVGGVARRTHWQWMATNLITHITNTPVVVNA